MRTKHPFSERIKRRRVIFFEIGLILSISISLYAFNYSQTVTDVYYPPQPEPVFTPYISNNFTIEKDEPEAEKPIPQPKKKQQKPTHVIKVVKNDEPVNNQPLQIDSSSFTDGPIKVSNDLPVDPGTKTTTQAGDPGKTVLIPDLMPEFNGGEEAMLLFIRKNVKYPEYEKENGNSGRVVVQFVVQKDGTIRDIKIRRSAGPYFDHAAMEVVRKMPRWNPGRNRGGPVDVHFFLPIRFELR